MSDVSVVVLVSAAMSVCLTPAWSAGDAADVGDAGRAAVPVVSDPTYVDQSDEAVATMFELRIDQPRGCDRPVTIRYCCRTRKIELIFHEPINAAALDSPPAATPISPLTEIDRLTPTVGPAPIALAD